VYLPLSEAAAALGTPVRVLTPRSATLALPAQEAGAASLHSVPVRYVDRVAYVPLAALADLPGVTAAARRAPAGVNLTFAGRTLTFPVNLPVLAPLVAAPEYQPIVRR